MSLHLDPAVARERVRCSVATIDEILPDCLRRAEAVMSPATVEQWLDGVSQVCGLGRGTELPLILLDTMPEIVAATDEGIVPEVAEMAAFLSRAVCGRAINPFLSGLPTLARRVESADSLRQWFAMLRRVVALETPEAVEALCRRLPFLIEQISLAGVESWMAYGLRTYTGQPHRLPEYFAMQTPDSHAAFQRQRHGTLFVDHERRLTLYMIGFWGWQEAWRPYSLVHHTRRRPMPHLDKLGFHLPDVLDDVVLAEGRTVPGIDLYRAMVAHMAAHRLWSRPYLADNYSPFQHICIEAFEDARVEHLAMARYPGLRRLWLDVHPTPEEGTCPEGWSDIRLRLALLSRAILDPGQRYEDAVVMDFAGRFREAVAETPEDPGLSVRLGIAFLTKIFGPHLNASKVFFENTLVPYRDDNRYLWHFLEESDDPEEDFTSDHGTPDPDDEEAAGDPRLLPPRLYPEWDQGVRAMRPDWATVHEAWAPAGDGGVIDGLLDRNRALAAQIKRLVDRLKPQDRARLRAQKEGEDLDVDRAIGAMIDLRAGFVPDGRVYQRHITDGRDISVLLLLDLSKSLDEPVEGGEGETLLHLSQEAVALLGWAVEALGDPFAIAGFSSDARQMVRYQHFKQFAEPWGAEVKARLGGMTAGSNTRMGAALRHATDYLAGRPTEKKLLLLLSDGRPHDVDVDDPEYLKWDAHAAVAEARVRGVTTFCITLDPTADDYGEDIFGPAGYAVVDQVRRLPEKLTRLFMALTKG